jgi:acyl-CoA reductase-like NAD-dependent aldehyde dehydrogenase
MAKLGSGSKLDVTEAYTVPAQINGRDVYFDSSFDVVSPATGEFLHHCTSASVADALEAVAAAHAAFPKWRDTLPNVKRDVFLKVAALMEGKSDELATIMTDETGSDEFWGKKMNVPLSVDILKDVAGRIATLGGIVPVTGVKGTSSIIYKEPFGAILAIAPWCV